MAYATTEDVRIALDLDSLSADQTTVIERLIETAEAIINEYCDCNFEHDSYEFELWGEDSKDVFPPVTNIDRIIWAGIDNYSIIKIAANDVSELSWEKDENRVALVVDGIRSETTFVETNTIQDVLDWINAIGSVTATLEDDDFADYPAWIIWNEFRTWAEASNVDAHIYVQGATENIKGSFQVTDSSIKLNRVLSEGQRMKLIVRAGYASIPDAVEQATITLCVMLYRIAETDFTKKSEKIGDYSYTLKDGQDFSRYVNLVLGPMLKPYRNISV